MIDGNGKSMKRNIVDSQRLAQQILEFHQLSIKRLQKVFRLAIKFLLCSYPEVVIGNPVVDNSLQAFDMVY